MRRLVLSLLTSLLVLSPFAHAEVVDNLYQVREPVTSQQPDERNAALKRALQELVVRLTGNPQSAQAPALASALAAPWTLSCAIADSRDLRLEASASSDMAKTPLRRVNSAISRTSIDQGDN